MPRKEGGIGAKRGGGGESEGLVVEIGEEEMGRGRQPGLGEGGLGDLDGEVVVDGP